MVFGFFAATDNLKTGGNDLLNGAEYSDSLFGQDGADWITLFGGGDTIGGCSGWDYPLYDLDRSECDFSTESDVTTVTYLGSAKEGTDAVTNVEALVIVDGKWLL